MLHGSAQELRLAFEDLARTPTVRCAALVAPPTTGRLPAVGAAEAATSSLGPVPLVLRPLQPTVQEVGATGLQGALDPAVAVVVCGDAALLGVAFSPTLGFVPLALDAAATALEQDGLDPRDAWDGPTCPGRLPPPPADDAPQGPALFRPAVGDGIPAVAVDLAELRRTLRAECRGDAASALPTLVAAAVASFCGVAARRATPAAVECGLRSESSSGGATPTRVMPPQPIPGFVAVVEPTTVGTGEGVLRYESLHSLMLAHCDGYHDGFASDLEAQLAALVAAAE